MTFTQRTLIALAIAGLMAPAAYAADPATVNGKPIKQSLVDFILKDAPKAQAGDDAKAAVVNKLIAQELLIQEAQKAGLDKRADYITSHDLMTRELLVRTYLQDYVKKNPVDEASIKAEYDKLKAQMGDKEYSAQHILVKTEQEAKDIVARLDKGEDFGKIAKEKSQDPGSKEKGGDLGWFAPAGMVKPFADAVAALQKGKYTAAPVQSQFGWHVIKLNDTRASQPPAYEKVKDGIQQDLQQLQLGKLVNDLRAKAKIVDNSAATPK